MRAHEVEDGASWRGFGVSRVACTCGASFLCWADFDAHVEAAAAELAVDGPGSVPWAVDLLRAAVGRGVTSRGAAAVAAFIKEWEQLNA